MRVAKGRDVHIMLVQPCEVVEDEVGVGLDSKDIVHRVLEEVLYYYQEFISKQDFLLSLA